MYLILTTRHVLETNHVVEIGIDFGVESTPSPSKPIPKHPHYYKRNGRNKYFHPCMHTDLRSCSNPIPLFLQPSRTPKIYRSEQYRPSKKRMIASIVIIFHFFWDIQGGILSSSLYFTFSICPIILISRRFRGAGLRA